MTQKAAKKKSKKNSKSGADASVLGNLRTTRPTRIGGERRAATRTRSKAAATKPKAAKPRAPKADERSPAAAAQSKATAAHRPAAPPPPRAVDGRPKGTEIVTTAVQAAGELAQIGATVGSQLLKRAARRVPRR